MPGLRDAITKTLLRLSRGAEARPSARLRNSRPSSVADNALQTGRHLGPYRLVKHLGAGGMGRVYLALQTRLGRHVALKFLPPDLTADEEMLRRLESEAQTASRLNHPNILTIYDVGQLEGEHYIASEYVDGATLRNAFERHAVDPVTAIDIVSQVLSALAAAHTAGVIHRDLKPGNIMIRHDGYVKVIDFGLAKQTRRSPSSESTWTDAITRLGSVIGTVDYMSPEQARGDPVDHRTDLWSLGVILYEAVAHHRPFDGDTENHVIVNILDKPAPPIAEISGLPAGLSDVIQRALVKDPGKRYQTAREMLADLQAIRQSSHLQSSVYPLPAPLRPQGRKPLVWAGTLLASFVALGMTWWFFYGRDRFSPKLTRLEVVRQLTFDGRVQVAAISHNGNYLAYAAGDVGGEQTLYLKQSDSPSEGEVRIPARKINYIGLTFSPDDQSLFEVEEDESFYRKLYVVPLLGSRSNHPVLIDIDGPVSFSPNGRQFAFVRFQRRQVEGRDQTESNLYIASRDGAIIRKLFSSVHERLLRRLAWSPQGDRIAAFLVDSLPDAKGQIRLVLIYMAGHETRWPLLDWRLIGQPVWTENAKAIVVSASTNTESDDRAQLRQIDAASGAIHDVTKELFGYRSASVTADHKSLAAVRIEARARIWVSGVNDFRRGTSGPAEPEQQHPNLSWTDEQHIIINSKRSGYPNFWTYHILTQALSSLTNERFVGQSAVAVPGGRFVVFTSNRSGQFHIWRLDLQSEQLSQLTFGTAIDQFPAVTPDGQWVVYTSWSANNPYLRKVPIKGGPSMQIGSYLAENVSISPDGKSMAGLLHDPIKLNTAAALIDMDGMGTPRLLPHAQMPLKWLPRGNLLTGLRTDSKGVSNVWTMPLDDSEARQLTDFDDQTILNFEWSPDGSRLACLRASLGRDVVLFRMQQGR